jgi:hypothetical protein
MRKICSRFHVPALLATLAVLAFPAVASAETVSFGFMSMSNTGDPTGHAMGAQTERIQTNWCDIQPYSRGTNLTGISDGFQLSAINALADNIQAALDAGYTDAEVNFLTDAPYVYRAGNFGGPDGTCPAGGPGGGYHYSIGPGSYAGQADSWWYGQAALKLWYCLRGNASCPFAISSLHHTFSGTQLYGLEVGNETNTRGYWEDDPTDGDNTVTSADTDTYAAAVASAAQAIHLIYPATKVASGGITEFSDATKGFDDASGEVYAPYYLAEMLNWRPNMDVNAFGYHPYGVGAKMNVSSGVETNINIDTINVRNTVDAYSAQSGKPLWITEVGDNEDVDATQSSELTSAYTTIKNRCASTSTAPHNKNIDLVIWFTLSSQDPKPSGWNVEFVGRQVSTDWQNWAGGPLLTHNVCNT